MSDPTNERFFRAGFADLPLMAILRRFDRQRTLELCTRAWDHGIPMVEIPVQSPDAVAALTAATRAGAERGASVGAGTVTTIERVEAAAKAGAAFTVAPGFSRRVAEASIAAGMPHLPGVATASEIQRAMELGLTWLKAFPAAELGTSWFRAMHGPFPEVSFVATGGMSTGNAERFLAEGASAVSLGSALADAGQLAALPELVDRVRGAR
ncbi:bifunctional 4-hydroxy-2-oxoglutarate aldolase/2-dehydro-3-deoxy-phosphogluconate aldolase [Pseudonocardia spinosispora]|uniref:bifunctional 4-hydroxy-2-oxoglutarate aldolase/2-dehydro-3-deoxy-phosphogluconate aldolase n=1 Tax=Pseudonocardia spinosispora TaxID=103441 RepID=UPI001FE0AFE9|nr:bifunctional 4-hydroxy-2-oxoglutarate aldolase/2-dehydro-3-deoxy-phosphogluconate aldolase [Pseudonocardia spinosispora]